MCLIDEEAARAAVALALPSIERAMRVCMESIVVAVSGMQPWYDEALAGVVACFLRAIAQGRAATAAREGPFLTG